jgi:hypothetical protein
LYQTGKPYWCSLRTVQKANLKQPLLSPIHTGTVYGISTKLAHFSKVLREGRYLSFEGDFKMPKPVFSYEYGFGSHKSSLILVHWIWIQEGKNEPTVKKSEEILCFEIYKSSFEQRRHASIFLNPFNPLLVYLSLYLNEGGGDCLHVGFGVVEGHPPASNRILVLWDKKYKLTTKCGKIRVAEASY